MFTHFQEIIVRNASPIVNSLMSVFPTGDYKMMFLAFDEKDENFATVNVIGSLMSSNKDTFG